MGDILQSLLLHTKVKLIPLYQLQNYDKNLNQDIISPEKNRGHWASIDVMKNDVSSDEVVFFNRFIALLNHNINLPSFLKIL